MRDWLTFSLSLAFILYRQHRQAQVVAQNPGLANPEISKIIGDEWRSEPEERKNQWKRLAEEEKQRHARQYPDYRYQPRRGNKGVPPRLTTATGEDPGRCPKCGGRYIATPRTPLTPFVSPPASGNSKPWTTGQGGQGSNQSHSHTHAHTPRPDMGDAHHYRHGSQSSSHGHAEMSAHGRGPWHGGGHAGHPGLHDINEDYEPMSASPSESKRRRYNPSGNGYHGYPALPSPPGSYGGGHPHPQRHQYPSISGPSSGPLSGPSMVSHAGHPAVTGPPQLPMAAAPAHGHGHMGPPPRPSSVSAPSGHGSSQFDESLRLPPLQTQLPTSPDSDKSMEAYSAVAVPQAHPPPPPHAPPTGSWYPHTHPHPHQHAPPYAHSLQAPPPDRVLSFEENFMSIPYYNKLMFLEYIQPRLPHPTLSMPRGPLIAIEGSDARLLRMIGPVVEHALLTSRECDVRMWLPSGSGPGQGLGQGEGDAPVPVSGSLDDTPMTDFIRTHAQAQRSAATSRSGSVGGSASANPRTGTDSSATAHPFVAIFQDMIEWHVKSAEIAKFIMASGTRGPPTGNAPRMSDASSSSAEQGAFHSRTASPASQGHGVGQTQGQQKPRLPIALLPEGYSLTLSDRAACACAHVRNVHYKPVDHWQWMGALWRDMAGPDLVVHVQAAGSEDDSPLGIQGGGGIEVRAPGLMLVRVSEREAREGLSEKTERRLGFEVVEWVRGGVFWGVWGNS